MPRLGDGRPPGRQPLQDALRLSCTGLPHRALIARYGGDAFAILAPADGLQEIEQLRGSIDANLAEMSKGLPYELSVSVGIVKAEKEKDMKALIGEADAKLYEAKKARPKK